MRRPDSYLEVDGARLRFRDEGEGLALLLVHGWALDLDVWEPQLLDLRQRFRIIRFDRRGFGSSTGEPSLAADVQDVQSLLDALEVQCAVCVGASQGARVAVGVALAAPERVANLVLDGPPDLLDVAAASEVPLEHYRSLARSGELPALRRLWSLHPLSQLANADACARQRLAAIIERYPGRDLLQPRPTSASFSRAELGSISVPTLVVNGELELETRRASGVAVAAAIPRAEQRVIPRAGHLPNLDNASAYNDALRQFLAPAL